MWLHYDGGEAVTVKLQQALGDESPLEFDDDGYAWVEDDEAAQQAAAISNHLTTAPARPAPGAGDEGDEEPQDFDAEAFVDRTPMSDVVEDLESGDYDAHLDTIEAEAERQGVLDAIDARRE